MLIIRNIEASDIVSNVEFVLIEEIEDSTTALNK